MKASTKTERRKRRKQKTSLLRIVGSEKDSIQQKMTARPIAARKRKHEAEKIKNSFPESRYTGEQLMNATSGIRETNHRKTYQTLQPVVNTIQNDVNCCGCFLCKTRNFEIAQQNANKMQQLQNQIQMAKSAWIFREQQMSKYQLQQITNASSSVPQNKPEYGHYENVRKRARLYTTALNPSLTGTTTDNFKYFSDQQLGNFTNQTNWPAANMQINFNQLTNFGNNIDFQNLYFPGYHHNHIVLPFQGTAQKVVVR